MASSLTVKVHPIVYMTIVDSFERRSQKSTCNNRALGTLLGFYEKDVVQVTNCYAIPFREAADMPEINDQFNKQMYQVCKRAAPSEQVVGWFFTAGDFPMSIHTYHAYYVQFVADITIKKELPPVVLLTMDTTFSEQGRLPVNAFIRNEAGIPGRGAEVSIFNPLNVVLETFPGENVALGCIMKGIDSERREAFLDQGLDQLEKSTANMVEWLEQILVYVEKVLAAQELPENATIGRKLMEVVTEASTQLQPEKLENLVKNSLRDYMMVSYISQLAKTQLTLQEKMIAITL